MLDVKEPYIVPKPYSREEDDFINARQDFLRRDRNFLSALRSEAILCRSEVQAPRLPHPKRTPIVAYIPSACQTYDSSTYEPLFETIHDLYEFVCGRYDVEIKNIIARDDNIRIILARQEIAYLMYKSLRLSMAKIGKLLSRGDKAISKYIQSHNRRLKEGVK